MSPSAAGRGGRHKPPLRYDASRMALTGPRQHMIEASGYVLVGGRSSRFGSAKALHRLDGRALALRVADALSERVGAVTLVGNRELYETTLGIPTIEDRVQGAGPLGGIVAALRHSRQRWCIVAACDMPLVNAALVDKLLRAAGATSVEAIVPQTPDGRLQPLFAAYAKPGLAALERALLQGTRKVTDALDGVKWARLAVDDARLFANINRPSDLSASG